MTSNNISREELEKSKLQAEIDFLKKKLQTENKVLEEKNQIKPKESKILPRILTIVSILAGLFAILFPSLKFLQQQKAEYKFQFDKEMVEYVSDLNSKDIEKQEQAALMLSYFESDALPILLYKLERTEYKQKSIISNVLKNIKDLSRKDKILIETIILDNSRKFYQMAYQDTLNIIDNKVDGLLNYIYVLGELGNNRKNEIGSFLKLVEDSIDTYKFHELTIEDLQKEITSCKQKLKILEE